MKSKMAINDYIYVVYIIICVAKVYLYSYFQNLIENILYINKKE